MFSREVEYCLEYERYEVNVIVTVDGDWTVVVKRKPEPSYLGFYLRPNLQLETGPRRGCAEEVQLP